MVSYVEELFRLKNIRTDTKVLFIILDTKYKMLYLKKVMKEKFKYLT